MLIFHLPEPFRSFPPSARRIFHRRSHPPSTHPGHADHTQGAGISKWRILRVRRGGSHRKFIRTPPAGPRSVSRNLGSCGGRIGTLTSKANFEILLERRSLSVIVMRQFLPIRHLSLPLDSFVSRYLFACSCACRPAPLPPRFLHFLPLRAVKFPTFDAGANCIDLFGGREDSVRCGFKGTFLHVVSRASPLAEISNSFWTPTP